MFKNQAETDFYSNIDDILYEINKLQKELIFIVSQEGFNSSNAATVSQELDAYIMMYHIAKKDIHSLSLLREGE
ncbi:aspartyl-phosphate phosphatase Spo0E family protein [Bacillus sp. B1-b2]|uniref:aspartyl-phosphate phosphatase Spo0E family protein n=1 Tax=Bacillus sp. B1-b2 TaxID=2653201 RepID=UPI00186A48AD|nr:aspartyl-phosphate phosphatase Spo0E family protein [Bacillus sp. B1-b2]